MGKIADPIREHVSNLGWGGMEEWIEIADQIDHEYELRLESCRRNSVTAFARYIRHVVFEYTRGHKMKYRPKANMLIELDDGTDGATGSARCGNCFTAIDQADVYCRHCGAKMRRQK